ncbi:MAG: peptidoglycan glycosyltransferase [Streptosporangiaceae bacterium]|nr:peptidoglycan glycosyltransferase [Streptosporangiaceae bacterium]
MTQRGREPGRPGSVTGARRPGDRRPGERRPGDRRSGDRPRGMREVRRGAPQDTRGAPRDTRGAPRDARGAPRDAPPPVRGVRRITAPRGEPSRRLGISLLCIIFVLSLFAGRLVQLQGMESGRYRTLAEQQRLHPMPLPAVRGSITGADGQILAMTVQTYTVFADPPMMMTTPLMTAAQLQQVQQRVATRLAGPLGMPAAAILAKIQHPTSRDYVILEQNVPAQAGDEISALNLPGINMTGSYARAYPDGNATADVVGFTSTDPGTGAISGRAGVEQAYNSLLAGRPGSEQVEIGTAGEPIPLAGMRNSPAVNGSSVRLTIVPALQFAAQQACKQRVQQTRARDCTVVVIQPKTGHILAMAQWPTYSQANPASAVNYAVQDVFEPGSTAKVITAGAAFERGGQTPMSAYDIPYQIHEGGQLIHDAEWAPGERYTIAGIIAHSSNIGMSQVASHISPQVQYDYLRAFGLGRPTGVGLPGESPGILRPLSQYWASLPYTLSFGQGVDVTALQMASVYATIANGGVRVQPNLVEGITSASGHYTPAAPAPARRVIKPKTARELIQIMQQVPGVDAAGDQPWGVIPGYAVAAKTGTSQEAGPKCPRSLCEYGSSWIGMAPGNNPQVVVAVNVQDPRRGAYFGAVVAGPVFYKVMEFALQTLLIPPDDHVVPYLRLNAP